MFRHVPVKRWYPSDAAYFLVCRTAVGDPNHDESLSPLLGSEVCEGLESTLISWPNLLFCRHDCKVLQNVSEKVHVGVSDGRLGAWYLISFFLGFFCFFFNCFFSIWWTGDMRYSQKFPPFHDLTAFLCFMLLSSISCFLNSCFYLSC